MFSTSKRIFGLLFLASVIGACSVVSEKQQAIDDFSPNPEEIEIIRIEPARPKIELSEDLFYKFLVAEFAGQRGYLDVSIENYLELARSTRDLKVVKRATRIAIFARDREAAMEAAELWTELDPLNPDAYQVLAAISLRSKDVEKTASYLQSILEISHEKLNRKLRMIINLLGREKCSTLVMAVVKRLLAEYGDNPEVTYALANVAVRAGAFDKALALLRRATEMQPDNDDAVLTYINISHHQGLTDDAIEWAEKALKAREGNDFNIRMIYANLLANDQRLDEARRQFEILSVAAPNDANIIHALGLLHLWANHLDQSEIYFKRLIQDNDKYSSAKYYLGCIAEDRKDFEKAKTWYQSVQKGKNYFDAQVRYGVLMANDGNVEAARQYLSSIQASGLRQITTLIQTEAELLIGQGEYGKAMLVYDRVLTEQYNRDLYYSRAMLAVTMDRLDILEQDLRRIIAEDSEDADALNALGYTLADKTERHLEAYELIERALNIDPNSYTILDSMGWVLYRMGRHEEAIEYLNKAMAYENDPEVAAHLGEVLWITGNKRGAEKVWKAALQTTPASTTKLIDVIDRFSP